MTFDIISPGVLPRDRGPSTRASCFAATHSMPHWSTRVVPDVGGGG